MTIPQDAPSVIAFYGNAASCQKYLLFPTDWAAAMQAPDASKWALSAQSGTVVDRSVPASQVTRFDLVTGWPSRNPQGVYLEPGFVVNNPSWGFKYPGPT
jgi:hypothetical protein